MGRRTQFLIGAGGGALLIAASLQDWAPIGLTPLEAFAVVFSAWSVWLLSQNRALGWWMGLVGVTAYGFVFYRAQLYAEVGIQAFYFITSLQAIWIWLYGGADRSEKPVGRASGQLMLVTFIAALVATLLLRQGLIAIEGAAPLWDALTTVMSLVAHLYLMARYVDSWIIWVAVDIIYVPLYASRELYLTSLLYLVFLLLALRGLLRFRAIYRSQELA